MMANAEGTVDLLVGGGNNGAAGLQVFDHDVRLLGDPVLVDQRALGGAHTLDVNQILNNDRQSRQPGLAMVRRGHAGDLPGLGGRAIGAEGRNRVDFAIHFAVPLKRCIQQF